MIIKLDLNTDNYNLNFPQEIDTTETESYTADTYDGLMERARNNKSPYYVFAILTLLNDESNITYKVYDAISHRIAAPSTDPTTRLKIERINYFAIPLFNSEENKAYAFPPSSIIQPLKGDLKDKMKLYYFSGVNFFAGESKSALMSMTSDIRMTLAHLLDHDIRKLLPETSPIDREIEIWKASAEAVKKLRLV